MTKLSMPKGQEEIRFEPFKTKTSTVGSIRVFYDDKGTMKPGRQGLTLKKSEIKQFVANLKELYAQLPDEGD